MILNIAERSKIMLGNPNYKGYEVDTAFNTIEEHTY